MADPTTDFLKDYQALAKQSWDAWMRQWQQAGGVVPSAFAAPPSPAGDLFARSAAGLKGFFDWMQGAAAVPTAAAPDWQQQLQQWFGAGAQPFAQAFAGLDQNGAHGFAQQWQQWMQAAQQQGGMADLRALAPMAPLGYTREQQLRQQALSKAMLEYLEASARYQALIQRVNAQGVERMQAKLAQRSERSQPVESLKALYDLWVDAAEEAYAEVALSDEFREAYGAMVNAQMQVRHLQQQETERTCRELGMPTRSEMASIGQRLQELRREMAELKRRQKERPAPVVAAVKPSTAKPSPKSAASAKAPAKPAVAVTKSRSRTAARANARTRK